MTQAVAESYQVADPPELLNKTNPVRPAPAASLFRVIWRWHFYAGMIVSPVLITMALTGALYLFKAEIEGVLHSRLMQVVPRSEMQPLLEQVSAATTAVQQTTPGLSAWRITLSEQPTRATQVTFRGGQPPRFLHAYVDPYDGKMLGTVDPERGLAWFFSTVLSIHRRLYAGTTGRFLTELTTCWTFILLITGLCLWWPRSWSKVQGVWMPRWRAKLYMLLRDLHAISGAILTPVLAGILVTGLWYSLFLGTNFRRIAENAELGKPLFAATLKEAERKATQKKDSEKGSAKKEAVWAGGQLESLVAFGQRKYPGKQVYVSLQNLSPDKVEVGAFNAEGSSGPIFRESMIVNPQTLKLISEKKQAEQSTVQWWGLWNYPIHVGSILGIFSKIIWFCAALTLAALPVTGLWMWWERRPTGSLGLPRRQDVQVPYWLGGIILLLCCLMPLAGASIIVILLADWIVQRIQFRRAVAGQHQPSSL